MRTYSPKLSEITHTWHVIDAEGLVLGRVATEAARLLRGKHKPIFTPHIDTGDFVLLAKNPITLVSNAVKGMIPHTRLGRAQFGKLFIYTGPTHPHAAQQPQQFDTSAIRRG